MTRPMTASMSTTTRSAAAAGEAQGVSGRGRSLDAAEDGNFGVILADVAKDGTMGTPASESGSASSRAAPTTAQKPAPAVAAPLDVESLFARLAMTTPTGRPPLASGQTLPATTIKTRNHSTPSDAPGATGGTATVGDAASAVSSTLVAAAMASSGATDGADAQSSQGGDLLPTIETGSRIIATGARRTGRSSSESATCAAATLMPQRGDPANANKSDGGPVQATVAASPPGRMTPTLAIYATGAATPGGGDPTLAPTMGFKPTSLVTETDAVAIVGDQSIPPTQVELADAALVEIASHLAPARPRLPALTPVAHAAVQEAVPSSGKDAGAAKAETAPAPTPAEPTSAAPDADDPRVARSDLVAAPILAAEAAEAAGNHPLQQIADAVTTLAADASGSAPAATSAGAAKPSPTRSLVLHLAPATLGTITVRLHLAEGGLSVRLDVEKPATLGLISHSREALQAAIGATYTLDQLVIQGADAAPQPNAGSYDATRSDSGAFADQQAGNRRGGEDSSRQPARPPQGEARGANAGRADGLFV